MAAPRFGSPASCKSAASTGAWHPQLLKVPLGQRHLYREAGRLAWKSWLLGHSDGHLKDP